MLNPINKLFSKKKKGIGLEITPERIKIAQLAKQGQQYQLVKNISIQVPEGVFEEGQIVDSPALAELIKQALSENKIKAKNVATAVPMREAIVRIIPVPAELDEVELRDMVLNHEASLYLPYPREEVDLDYQKLGFFMAEDGIEKINVLLVATKKEVTDLYLDTFKQAELNIDVLEINSFALMRTIREQLRQFGSTEAVVLVDMEFDSTEIAIIVEGVPQFSRTIPIGTYQMQSAFAKAMNLPLSRNLQLLQEMTILNTPVRSDSGNNDPDNTWINPGMSALLKVLGELSDEIGRSISFYLNQVEDLEVTQLLLAGPGAGVGQIDEFFAQKLNLPAMAVDPVAALSLEVKEEISVTEKPGLATVLGLGLREV